MDRQNEHKLTGQPDFGWDMPNKPFLTIGEVADILQVSSRTVYNLIYKGTLRACRITYHITLITKEDFFLMIKESTYCKRSVSIFARQGKKTKKKMNGENKEKSKQPSSDKRERKEQRAARQNGGSFRRQATNSPCVTHLRTGRVSAATFIRWQRYAKSSITPTDGSTTSVCGTRYRASKPTPPNASRKRKWTRRWRRRTSGWATTFRSIGIRASTSCACSDWAKLKSAGSPSRTGYGRSAYTATVCTI